MMGVGGLNLKIEEAKGNFFDRRTIGDRVEQARKRNLSRLGAYIRTRAITLLLRHPIKKGFGAKSAITNRAGTAPPGQPPYCHTGDLARFLFFAFDGSAGSVVVGPALLNKASSTLDALEQGGTAEITVFEGQGAKRHPVTVQATFKARPFMGPALEGEKEASAKLWQDTIRA